MIARYDVERDGTLSGPYDEGDVCLWADVDALLRQRAQAIAEVQAALRGTLDDAGVDVADLYVWKDRAEHAEAQLTAQAQAIAQLQAERDTAIAKLRGLPPTDAAGLLLYLKAECEQQHARAEQAEAQLAAAARPALRARLRELVEQWRSWEYPDLSAYPRSPVEVCADQLDAALARPEREEPHA